MRASDMYDVDLEGFEKMFQDILDNAGVDDHFKALMKQHDDIMMVLSIREVLHLLDLMQLKTGMDLEFRKPTAKGKIQLEAQDGTINKIRKSLLDAIVPVIDEIEEIGHIDFTNVKGGSDYEDNN